MHILDISGGGLVGHKRFPLDVSKKMQIVADDP